MSDSGKCSPGNSETWAWDYVTREGLSSEEEAARNSRAKESASSRGSEDNEKAREAGEAGS